MTELDGFKKGTVEMLMLKLLSQQDCYGYQISKLIYEITDGIITLPEGSMYPALYRLEEKNYISHYKKKVGKRMERVYYHIEQDGCIYLNNLILAYNNVTQATEKILNYDFFNSQKKAN